ncbi:MAG: HD-GYP domain-containing protein [Gemmatimonadota bacterium]
MTDAVAFLTSFAQALARMSLYAPGHPARARAAESSFARLRDLVVSDQSPSFTFLGDEVVYSGRPLRELEQWDWARKLSDAGVQRVEFTRDVSDGEYLAFLESVLSRIVASRSDQLLAAGTTTAVGTIRFGGVGVRGLGNPVNTGPGELHEALPETSDLIDLTEEADAIEWMHSEIISHRRLPLAEAEVVVASLAAAMHSSTSAIIPLLSLKEFDQYTTTHSLNVAVLTMSLAEHLGLSAREVRNYGMSGLLHDLGKVRVPADILRKPGKLSDEEFAVLRQHPVDGARLILEADDRLDLCAVVAFEHHIAIDGGGYPLRRSRRDCHHASLLVHVCDVFDALRTHRPYRVAWEESAITQYLRQRTGSEFEATACQAFLQMLSNRGVHHALAESIEGERREASGAVTG